MEIITTIDQKTRTSKLDYDDLKKPYLENIRQALPSRRSRGTPRCQQPSPPPPNLALRTTRQMKIPLGWRQLGIEPTKWFVLPFMDLSESH